MKREVPFDVAAGATEVVDCTLEPATPGPFEAQLHVYVADPGLREMVLLVRGTARAAAPEARAFPMGGVGDALPH